MGCCETKLFTIVATISMPRSILRNYIIMYSLPDHKRGLLTAKSWRWRAMTHNGCVHPQLSTNEILDQFPEPNVSGIDVVTAVPSHEQGKFWCLERQVRMVKAL